MNRSDLFWPIQSIGSKKLETAWLPSGFPPPCAQLRFCSGWLTSTKSPTHFIFTQTIELCLFFGVVLLFGWFYRETHPTVNPPILGGPSHVPLGSDFWCRGLAQAAGTTLSAPRWKAGGEKNPFWAPFGLDGFQGASIWLRIFFIFPCVLEGVHHWLAGISDWFCPAFRR